MNICSVASRLACAGSLALAVTLSYRVAPVQPARADDHTCGSISDCYSDCCCPRWMVRADALILHRSDADSLPLVFEDNGAGEPGRELLNADDLDLGFAGGPRLSLIDCLNECYSLEVSYFGIDGWTARRTVDADFLQSIGSITPATGPATFAYGSELYSAEINLRRQRTPWLTFFTGLRMVELHEDLIADFSVPGFGAQQYVIDTDNHLYGTQAGIETLIWDRGPWRFDAVGKLGLYANNADQNTVDRAVGGVFAESDHTAFLGEFAIGGTYQVTSCLAARTGYQLLWLDGVVLAPDQIIASDLTIVPPVAGIDDHGDAFYQGVYVGLEAVW